MCPHVLAVSGWTYVSTCGGRVMASEMGMGIYSTVMDQKQQHIWPVSYYKGVEGGYQFGQISLFC